MSETFVCIKPDAVRRHLVGRILSRIEDKGFEIVRMRMETFGRAAMGTLYDKFAGKEFAEDLISFMTNEPALAMIVAHPLRDAVATMRELIGAATDGPPPGTIRGDFAENFRRNIIHASDSPENAEREIRLFFHGYLD